MRVVGEVFGTSKASVDLPSKGPREKQNGWRQIFTRKQVGWVSVMCVLETERATEQGECERERERKRTRQRRNLLADMLSDGVSQTSQKDAVTTPLQASDKSVESEVHLFRILSHPLPFTC